jgi:hypothetical protein
VGHDYAQHGVLQRWLSGGDRGDQFSHPSDEVSGTQGTDRGVFHSQIEE